MKAIKNIIRIVVHFCMFFVVTLLIHSLLYFTRKGYFLVLSDFIIYFFIIALVASIITAVYLGATRKMYKGIPLVLSMIMFSVMMSLFYIVILYFNYNSTALNKNIENDILSSKDSLYIDENKFNVFDEYSIYVKKNIGNDLYSGVIISENDSERLLYSSYNGLINSQVIRLYSPEVFNFTSLESRNAKTLDLKDFNKLYNRAFIKSMPSEGIIFYATSLIVNTFLDSGNNIYSLVVLFVSFFILLLGLYSIVYSLSSPVHLFYNILVVIVLYFIVDLIATSNILSLNETIKSLTFTGLSISLIFIGVMLNIFAFVCDKVFNFSKYYKG